MKHSLLADALIKFAAGCLLVGLLLFLPAGTLRYPDGWLLMGILFVPMFAAGLVMLKKSPDLLRSRLNAKEKLQDQDRIVRLSGLMFVASFVLAGLDFRFGWTHLPPAVTAAAVCLFLAIYGMYAEVLRENAYLSRTVQVQNGQRVIDTGLYAIVRHPMYSATLLLFLAMPLVLGSLPALAAMLPYPILIARRIRSEEAYLAKHLPGYAAYREKVRWRLVPYIW